MIQAYYYITRYDYYSAINVSSNTACLPDLTSFSNQRNGHIGKSTQTKQRSITQISNSCTNIRGLCCIRSLCSLAFDLCSWSCSLREGGTSFRIGCIPRKLKGFIYMFRLFLHYTMFYLLLLYGSPSFFFVHSFLTLFHVIYSLNQLLLLSLEILVHHKDWSTYCVGTGELILSQ